MINRCKGCFLPDVALIIARNYDLLLRLCCVSRAHNLGSVEDMDVFHDTILHVSHDMLSRNFRTDTEFIEYFQYRYRMVFYQTCKDEKQYSSLSYADNLKTSENQEE